MAEQRVVRGIPEAIENLKKYQAVKVEAIKERLKKQAFRVELLAKEMVSVDTGRLKSSISTNWAGSDLGEGKTGAGAEAGDGVKRPEGSKELLYVVGSNVKYAPYQEFGTKRMTARPYLFPAYFSLEGETIKALAKIMKEDVRLG